jgi:hypothetical protein
MAAIGGGVISGGHKIDPNDAADSDVEELLDITFNRYFQTASLMGTLATCGPLIWQLKEMGVNEIACLIDFLDDYDSIMESLEYLNELRASFSESSLRAAAGQTMAAFMEDPE